MEVCTLRHKKTALVFFDKIITLNFHLLIAIFPIIQNSHLSCNRLSKVCGSRFVLTINIKRSSPLETSLLSIQLKFSLKYLPKFSNRIRTGWAMDVDIPHPNCSAPEQVPNWEETFYAPVPDYMHYICASILLVLLIPGVLGNSLSIIIYIRLAQYGSLVYLITDAKIHCI